MTGPSAPNGQEFSVGDSAPTVEVSTVRRRHFVQYAGASGDFNPIHYDEPYAMARGHDCVFGQGMLSAALVANAVADWFGLEHVTTLRTRFRSKLNPGTSVETVGEILSIDPGENDVAVIASVDLVTAEGTCVVDGRAEATIPY